jgi:hypothetical protein
MKRTMIPATIQRKYPNSPEKEFCSGALIGKEPGKWAARGKL